MFFGLPPWISILIAAWFVSSFFLLAVLCGPSISPFLVRTVGDCSLFSTRSRGNMFSFLDFFFVIYFGEKVTLNYNLCKTVIISHMQKKLQSADSIDPNHSPFFYSLVLSSTVFTYRLKYRNNL